MTASYSENCEREKKLFLSVITDERKTNHLPSWYRYSTRWKGISTKPYKRASPLRVNFITHVSIPATLKAHLSSWRCPDRQPVCCSSDVSGKDLWELLEWPSLPLENTLWLTFFSHHEWIVCEYWTNRGYWYIYWTFPWLGFHWTLIKKKVWI